MNNHILLWPFKAQNDGMESKGKERKEMMKKGNKIKTRRQKRNKKHQEQHMQHINRLKQKIIPYIPLKNDNGGWNCF
jgi:hypothetical protein